jgi:cellulose synthase operon protein C
MNRNLIHTTLKRALGLVLILSLSPTAFAENKNDKRGLLPELKLDDKSEEKNELKQLNSEIMISKTEDNAIKSLQGLLKKRKGTAQESDLLYRLAELYMRKAKTGRFFDLNSDSKTLKLSTFPVPPLKGKDWIRKASSTYYDIEKRFPQFYEMDGVLFNNAFANQQLGEIKNSENLYKKLLDRFPQSPLVPDGLIALGELLYDQARFKEARASFENVERFPESKVYSYGLYKLSWTLYNMKLSDDAIHKLVEVVEKNPPLIDPNRRYNLRQEALRDLVLFVSDRIKGEDLYKFFKKITTSEELGIAMMNTAKLYESYSREKEINTFLGEFLDNEKTHSYRVKAYMILVNSNEILKKRDEVLKDLEEGSKLCDLDSTWKARQEAAWATESCQNDYRKTSLEIARKWWDIWLKNKAHAEFSKFTERALRLVLKGDDPDKPDYKTRYALAELLFQQGQYDEASQQYEKVALTSTEPLIIHDANYAALYSMQKSIEKEKTKEKQDRIRKLSFNYIEKHPKGQHALPVQLQIALTEYEAQNDKEAERYLLPLVAQSTNKEVRKKSQDLMLDIYNLRKNFKDLKKMAAAFLKEADTQERKTNLQKIYEEAHYSEIQGALTDKPKVEVADMLIEFRRTHPESKLSKEALWQAISLAYTDGYSVKGADLSMDFIKQYPEDKRNLDALKEAAQAYLDTGRIGESLKVYQTLLKIATSENRRNLQDIIIDLYLIEKRTKDARSILKLMMSSASSSEVRKLQDRYLATFTDQEKSSTEYKQFEQQLISQGIEPLSTHYLTQISRKHLENKEWTLAFQTSTRIMTRNVDMGFRAEARYIQARVLEHELTSQSVKTSKEDRLSTVLNLKTDKLDKALTAYNSAAKMTKDPALIFQILEGLDRSYENFVSSLRSMELPSTLSAEDQAGVRAELLKITKPIEDKQKENKEAIAELNKKATPQTNGGQTQWADLRPDQTIPFVPTTLNAEKIAVFIPDEWKAETKWDLFTNRKPTCSTDAFKKDRELKNRPELLGSCFLAQNWKILENEALALTDTPTNRSWGLFYLSVLNEKLGYREKALWLNEKALKLSAYNDVFAYQKARLTAQLDGWNQAYPEFLKLYKSKISTVDLKAIEAIQASTTGNWLTVKEILNGFSKEDLQSRDLIMLYAEALNRSGDPEQAVRAVTGSILKNTLDAWLYIGKVFEVDKPELPRAQDSYKKALAAAKTAEQKTWIEKKIEYLNSLKK